MLDRAGVTGEDGASHNGMWDMSILQVVPGLRIAAPRDADQLREELREAVDGRRRADRGALPQGRRSADAVARRAAASAAWTCCAEPAAGDADVLLVAVGALGPAGLAIAGLLGAQGIGVHRRRPALGHAGRPRARRRWPPQHRLVVTVEDGGRAGGVGVGASPRRCATRTCDVPLRASASRSSSSPTAPGPRCSADSG